MIRTSRRLALFGLPLAGLAGVAWWQQMRKGALAARALHDVPLAPPDGPMRTFHLGHSLVGRDMPAMLAQLAGHAYESQLGWGTPLRDHWDPDRTIAGFGPENDHPRFRDARAAVGSGDYDAVVMTEMVELRDAIRYHDSATTLARWAELARAANPEVRLYLYETWHHLDDPAGWATRIAQDLPGLWKAGVLHPAIAASGQAIHLVPGGQVLAAFVARIEAEGGIDGIARAADLFAVTPEGTPDTIHLNDLGAYLVALTHYAVLYHRDPTGLPHALTRADGTPARAPAAEAARAMQAVVWDVVTRHPETGVAA